MKKVAILGSAGCVGRKTLEVITSFPNDFKVHPNAECGHKVAINCSTMMNKGLEIIQARHLFGIESEKIDVVIHPQSVVQSMVSFKDGVTKSLFANPDLYHPVQYALFERERRESVKEKFDVIKGLNLQFFPKDLKKFRVLKLAFDAMQEGGPYPAYLNAANEVLVERFCQGRVRLRAIGEILEELINNKSISTESTLEAVLNADREARIDVMEILKVRL